MGMRMWLSHDISQDHSGQELQESVSLQSQWSCSVFNQKTCPDELSLSGLFCKIFPAGIYEVIHRSRRGKCFFPFPVRLQY